MTGHATADRILADLATGVTAEVLAQTGPLAERLARSQRIFCYGVGREGLMMKAIAMRLFHLGLDTHVIGDMTVPPIAAGDTLLISAGPGDFATVAALASTARAQAATICCFTAQPGGPLPGLADLTITLPAQTMADDQTAPASILPMGSLYEALLFLFGEALILDLRDRLGQSAETMRARHTNLE
ncbi:6-phospho-3-hexuloisomerase [Dinoroseobacter sp. S375]|uniref:6-phospho-3-hexuloisomerase n=1 Tax=Dinoroseobacter sp. S375 TaxID=3415136 RepID=UPI003C7DECB8